MIPIKYLLDNTQEVKDSLKRRKDKEKLLWVDRIISLYNEYKTLKKENDNLRYRRNQITLEINVAKKQGKCVKKLLKEVKNLPEKIKKIDLEIKKRNKEMYYYLMRLPNILDKEVPDGIDEKDNVVIKRYGKKPIVNFIIKNHLDLVKERNLADIDSASVVSGARFYYLNEKMALLERALANYAIDFMLKKKYKFILPPYMMNRKHIEGVTDIEAFKDVIYKIDKEDLYLISTSEHPLVAKYCNTIFEKKELPKKLFSFTPCFRKEVGSHTKGDKGLWRVHHFNKVEQVIICEPEHSNRYFDELMKNHREFFDSLGVHYQEVNICTGDIGIVAAKKHDLEAYIPSEDKYKEVGSCSNCTFYQASRSNIKYIKGKDKKNKTIKEYVHTLNSTLVATSRALVVILEQFQKKDGSVLIPKVLRKYCGFDIL